MKIFKRNMALTVKFTRNGKNGFYVLIKIWLLYQRID